MPTLLLSGYYDPITPPAFAEVVAESLPNDYAYVLPTGSHGVAFNDPCIDNIMQQFLATPGREPDASCLESVERAPFVPPDALSFPFLAEVGQLTRSMWVQVSLSTLFLLGVLSAFAVLPIALLVSLLRKKEPGATPDPRQRGLKWAGGILALLFGALAIIFVIGAAYFTLQSLVSEMVNIFVLSGSAAPLFVIPPILVVLALALLFVVIQAWRKRAWSMWVRVYYTFVAICALGYVSVLAYGGMLTVLL